MRGKMCGAGQCLLEEAERDQAKDQERTTGEEKSCECNLERLVQEGLQWSGHFNGPNGPPRIEDRHSAGNSHGAWNTISIEFCNDTAVSAQDTPVLGVGSNAQAQESSNPMAFKLPKLRVPAGKI
jgi:hypothetical protein